VVSLLGRQVVSVTLTKEGGREVPETQAKEGQLLPIGARSSNRPQAGEPVI
jgi:hypothetical protein